MADMPSDIFQIIFWTALLLIVAIAGSIAVLTGMDPTTDALLYANDPLKKGM